MEKVCKENLEQIVALLNDPDETVMIKEVKEKLEKLLTLMNNPEEVERVKKENREKLEKVVALVSQAMTDPDIDLEYNGIPEAGTASEGYEIPENPYIHLKYKAGGTHIMEQKLPITRNYLKKTPEDLANLLIFYIEQFIEQIDSVENGAQ